MIVVVFKVYFILKYIKIIFNISILKWYENIKKNNLKWRKNKIKFNFFKKHF